MVVCRVEMDSREGAGGGGGGRGVLVAFEEVGHAAEQTFAIHVPVMQLCVLLPALQTLY